MIKKALIILVLFSGAGFAQYKNIKINTLENRPNEVSIAINPLNPLNIVAGANLSNTYYTMDGGNTWVNDTIHSDDNGVWGDPCLFYDTKGNAYYIHLSRPPYGKWLDRIVCQKSIDNGMTWGNPGTYFGLNSLKIQDKAWAIADWTNSKWRNNIYVSWTQFDKYNSRNPLDSSIILFSCSNDGGMTWSEAKRINRFAGDCQDSSNTVEGAVPCIGPNGEVYDVWAGPMGLVFNKSTDGGVTWMNNDKRITPIINGWTYDIDGIFRCGGLPVTCSDISTGPHKGTIYINWSDGRNGTNDVDIFIIKSSDGGNTWSNVKRVNDDKEKNGKQQFLSSMCVDPITGNIYVIYYDRRNYSDTQTDVYLARSVDGGDTFTNIKISESPFIPQQKIFFGDYIGISSYNDFAACIWQRIDNGSTNIQYCGIDFKK